MPDILFCHLLHPVNCFTLFLYYFCSCSFSLSLLYFSAFICVSDNFHFLVPSSTGPHSVRLDLPSPHQNHFLPCLAYSSALKMGAVYSYEMLVSISRLHCIVLYCIYCISVNPYKVK
jgi:hypothetical protein